jgi:hypothetical protein
MTLGITMLCYNAECRILFTIMLNGVMLSIIKLNVTMLSAVMLSVIKLNVTMLSAIKLNVEALF